MFYLYYMCMIAHNGVQHILCCVFILLVFVLCLNVASLSGFGMFDDALGIL